MRVSSISGDSSTRSGLRGRSGLREPKEGWDLISLGGAWLSCMWQDTTVWVGLGQHTPSLESLASLTQPLPCRSLDLGALRDGSVRNEAKPAISFPFLRGKNLQGP